MAIEEEDFSSSGITSPAADASNITPADVDLNSRTRGIYVGGSGDLVVTMAQTGNVVTLAGVLGGIVYPLRVTQIRAATTATGIVALF